MTTRTLGRAGLAPVALAMSLLIPAAAQATVGVDLRVEAPSQSLAQLRQYTGDVGIPTDPGAECFGAGTGGSGARAHLGAPTALGAVADGSATKAALRPLSITDHDFGFGGLGVCGLGGFASHGAKFWFLKVNHIAAQVGGSQLRVHRGDQVLWALVSCDPQSFVCPPDLVLRAPAHVALNVPFEVKVSQYDDGGARSPVTGATVTGATKTTNATGKTAVTLTRTTALRATLAKHISSPSVQVCASEAIVGACPEHRGKLIAGSAHRDVIDGTAGPDVIRARGGDDRINAVGGGKDRVNCGPGEDVAILGGPDTATRCESVTRR